MIEKLFTPILARLTDAPLADAIVGDLLQERHRRASSSPGRARAWLVRTLLAMVLTMGLKRLRDGLAELWLRRLGASGVAGEMKQALRAVRRTPVASAVIVVTLAIGFGINTAIFSVVYGVLFRPLPFDDPGRIVLVEGATGEQAPSRFSVSLEDYRDIVRTARSSAGLGVAGYWTFNLTDVDTPLRIVGVRVDGGFFETLGTDPLLGRWLAAEDDRPGVPERVVIGYRLWQRQFAGSKDVMGREIRLNGRVVTVVGVMPPAFRFPGEDVEIWAAIRDEMDGTPRNVRFWSAFGRLARGVTIEQANAELQAIVARLAREHPDTNRRWRASLVPALSALTTNVREGLMLLLWAVTLVFVVTCVNVGAMMFSRYATRGPELSVRSALGATPARLVRLSCVESAWLGTAGLGLGLAAALPAVALLRQAAPSTLPRIDDIALSWPVVWIALAATGLLVMVGSLAPIARRALRRQPVHEQAAPTRVTTTGRGRMTLVLAQVSLSFVIAVGAGLLVQSFVRVLAVHPGFEPDRLLTLRVFLGPPTYRSIDAQRQFVDRALEAVRRIPGVTAAGAVSQPPFDTEGSGSSQRFVIEGRAYETGAQPSVKYRAVDAGYFRAIGLPLQNGRELSADDHAHTPAVIVINRSMASTFWSNQNPIGARLRWPDRPNEPPATVVGVVGDVATDGLERQEAPAVYAPHTQRTLPFLRWMTFVVRTSGRPEAQAAGVRAALQSIDPSQPIFAVRTMQTIMAESLAERRFSLMLMLAFGGLALLLTTCGLYGALAQSVEDRRRELGVRLALGAVPLDIFWMVLRRGLILIVLGLSVGAAASYAASGYVRSLLFDVAADDTLTRVGIAAFVLVVSIAGCLTPARRASRVDPIVALRSE